MNKKTFILRADTLEELSKKINKEKREFFAAPTHQDAKDSSWVAVCWFEPKLANERKPNPNWRADPATEAQKRAMEERNLPFPEKITKGEASAILSEWKRSH